MLAMIIMVTFYVMCNMYYYLILATALWEGGCGLPRLTGAAEAQRDEFPHPELGGRRTTRQGCQPQVTWLQTLCFQSLLILKLGWWETVKKNRRGRKEESGLKFIVTMYLFTSARPNPSTPSTEGKRRLSEMSERFPVNVTVLDTGHFMNFQYSFLLPGSLVFLQYSFTKPDGNIMETTRHQDLNSALTWNLFLFHTPVGCYFPADALRVAHIKLTHCVELSRGGKGGPQRQNKMKREVRGLCFSLTLTWNLYV